MTFKTISVIIISLLLAHAPLSPAAKAETTLDSLVALALENNPELAGLKDRHAAANFDAKASGALPDPRVSLEFMGLPRSSLSLGESPMSGIALGISQMIPWPAKLRAMRAMADLETDLKGLQAARQRNRLIREVKETYYEYSALVLTRELLEQNIHLLEAMTGSAQAGYAAGLGTGRDLLAGQIRQTQLENRRRQIDLMLQMSLNRLVQLTGAEIQGDIKLAESLPEIEWAEDSVKATGIRKNPEFKMAELEKAMARQGLASARAEYWPDLMLGFKYQIRQSTPMDELEGEDFLSAEIGITVPLWFFSRQKNQTRSAEARLNAALQEEQAAALQLERMLADNHAALDITRISLQDIIRSIQPRARAALESAQAAFASGEAEFSDLLSAQMELLQIEMERLELLKQYHQLKAQLQEIIGDDEEGEL